MNSPVTHGECQQRMEILEQKFHTCMKEERVDLKEAIADVEEWVLRLENKISDTNASIDNLVREIAIIGIGALIAFIWGKL